LLVHRFFWAKNKIGSNYCAKPIFLEKFENDIKIPRPPFLVFLKKKLIFFRKHH